MQSSPTSLTARAAVAVAALLLGVAGGVAAGCGGSSQPASETLRPLKLPKTVHVRTQTVPAATTPSQPVPATTATTPAADGPSAVTAPSTNAAPPAAATTTTPSNPGGVAAPDDGGAATTTTTTPTQDPDCRPGTGPGQPDPQCEPVSGPDAQEQDQDQG